MEAVKNYHTAHKKDLEFYEQVIYSGSLSQPMPLTDEAEKKLQRAMDDALIAETRQRSVGEQRVLMLTANGEEVREEYREAEVVQATKVPPAKMPSDQEFRLMVKTYKY